MKRLGIMIFVVLACGLIFGAARPDPRIPPSLVRIAKGPALSMPALARLGIDVRQELATCLVALADRLDLRALRRQGLQLTVLERNAAGREFVLVDIRRPEAMSALQAAGRAVAVEPGTAVFWSDRGPAVESVPSGLARKVLPARSILPYLRTRAVPDDAPTAALAYDAYIVDNILPLVSIANLAADVQMLQDFGTRYASTAACESSGQALFDAFSALGLDQVRFEPFHFSGAYESRNVVAEKTGETYPDDVYIVCAHYDSSSPAASRQTLAPGADDNGSGVAAVLEAARALAGCDLDFTVRFIAFSAEEWGLYGSRTYAAVARTAGERILGVINLDMIAFADEAPEDIHCIVNAESAWLGDLFLDAGEAYGGVDGTRIVDPSFVYSDHAAFWEYGYPALDATEDDPLTNPYYHQITDTLDKLDLNFLVASARASTGLLAELAQPVKPGFPPTPVGLGAEWVVHRSLFNALSAVRLTWTAVAGAAGYNVYRSGAAHGEFLKANAGLVTASEFLDSGATLDGTYSYVVTAVGQTGVEGNRSKAVAPPADPSGAAAARSAGSFLLWSLR